MSRDIVAKHFKESAQGVRNHGTGSLRTTISFNDDMFAAIDAGAQRYESSFGQEVRRLVALGIQHQIEADLAKAYAVTRKVLDGQLSIPNSTEIASNAVPQRKARVHNYRRLGM